MPVDVRSKACSYLRGGKVQVLVCVPNHMRTRVGAVHARVEGHSSTYVVRLRDGAWTCTCRLPAECAHVAAVQLVTGHPSLAQKVKRLIKEKAWSKGDAERIARALVGAGVTLPDGTGDGEAR